MASQEVVPIPWRRNRYSSWQTAEDVSRDMQLEQLAMDRQQDAQEPIPYRVAACIVCGRECPFWEDICGRCERDTLS